MKYVFVISHNKYFYLCLNLDMKMLPLCLCSPGSAVPAVGQVWSSRAGSVVDQSSVIAGVKHCGSGGTMRRKCCTCSCPAQERWCPRKRAIVCSWTTSTKGFYGRNCFQVVICCFKCILICTGYYHHVALKSTNTFKKLLSTI